jgi:hypothetical protein
MFSATDLSNSTRVVPQSATPVVSQAVRLQKQETLLIASATAANETSVEAKKRFRRTREEIRLGLTAEQAQELRDKKSQESRARHGKRGKDKAPRAKRMQIIERKPVAAKPTDLIETLPPKIQARARAVSRYRSTGGKGLITAEMLDQIQAAVAAGKVTKCTPCTDSDGYNHLNQKAQA